jgi:biofilm PGA synthesis N-glycosyltransferase PgaC
VSSAATLWDGLAAFVFWYPLLMSLLWMGGAAVFWWRFERGAPRWDAPPPLTDPPPVSVLVPCYNEAENAEETIGHALRLDHPEFEVVAIDDGSTDGTGAILDRLAAREPRLRVVHLAHNQGKAKGLEAGALLARHEILIGIDGDALLDPRAARWLVRHLAADPRVAAVTGNPRIRNRSTLLGRVQVGEFSSLVGIIKRAQRVFGRIFTVSGVLTAFRRSAVLGVGGWSPDALTEDIDVTWKLHRAGWAIRFEPSALTWILMPETLRGLWKQRLRWAMGGAQVLLRNLDALVRPSQRALWPLLLESVASVLWSYAMLAVTVVWLLGLALPAGAVPRVGPPLGAGASGLVIGAACLVQLAFATWLDRRHDRGLFRNLFWMIWFPIVFWVLNCAATVVAYPKVLVRRPGRRARWVSPDRGIRP